MIETGNKKVQIKTTRFGLVDGKDVSLFQLSNGIIDVVISNFKEKNWIIWLILREGTMQY